MKAELQHAVTFLVDTLKDKLPNVSDDQLRTLRTRLTDLLAERYENHWYVDKPLKGSAFRCINICIEDHSIDLALRRAAHDGGISENDIVSVFPNGLALWIDPDDVSGRMGKGAIFPIYKKIPDNRTVVTEPASSGLQHRPQQRPRSISPPQSLMSPVDVPSSSKPISTSVSRLSKTPPGFRSLDAGQNFYTLPNQNNGRSEFPNNIQNLWRTQAPANTTTSQHMNTARNPVSYVSTNKYNSGDAVYSFNQYSSYYNPHFHRRKETPVVSGANAPQKSLWQDDDNYQRTHWFRESNKNSSSKLAVAGNNLTFNKMQNYGYGISRQVQEVY